MVELLLLSGAQRDIQDKVVDTKSLPFIGYMHVAIFF